MGVFGLTFDFLLKICLNILWVRTILVTKYHLTSNEHWEKLWKRYSYVYFSILYNFIFGDILLSRSQIFIDGCNPKDNIEKYVKNNIDNLSKMVPSYCSCLHKRNWKKLFFNLSKSKNLMWKLCATMMSWVRRWVVLVVH